MAIAQNSQKVASFNVEPIKEAAFIFAFPAMMLVWAITSYQ